MLLLWIHEVVAAGVGSVGARSSQRPPRCCGEAIGRERSCIPVKQARWRVACCTFCRAGGGDRLAGFRDQVRRGSSGDTDEMLLAGAILV